MGLGKGQGIRAFSGEVDSGSPSEDEIKQREIERNLIPSKRDSL
jgi:hypothetical protein